MNLIQRFLVFVLSLSLLPPPMWAQEPAPGQTVDYTQIGNSWSFTNVYKVPEPGPVDFANSPRLDQLMRDGKIYLSLADAIALAVENNLDIAYARYEPLKADADILRANSGGQLRGVQTQISTLSTGQSASGGGARGGDAGGAGAVSGSGIGDR